MNFRPLIYQIFVHFGLPKWPPKSLKRGDGVWQSRTLDPPRHQTWPKSDFLSISDSQKVTFWPPKLNFRPPKLNMLIQISYQLVIFIYIFKLTSFYHSYLHVPCYPVQIIYWQHRLAIGHEICRTTIIGTYSTTTMYEYCLANISTTIRYYFTPLSQRTTFIWTCSDKIVTTIATNLFTRTKVL